MFLWGIYEFVFGISWGGDLAEVGFWGWLFPLVGLAKLLVAAVLLQILLFKKLDDITKGELAVIILSDPVLWWAVHYLVSYV